MPSHIYNPPKHSNVQTQLRPVRAVTTQHFVFLMSSVKRTVFCIIDYHCDLLYILFHRTIMRKNRNFSLQNDLSPCTLCSEAADAN